MFGLDLSPQLEGAVEAFVVVFVALVLFLLKDEKCQPTVKAAQRVLEEIQESLSETERGERMLAQTKKGAPKKTGPFTDLASAEVKERGKHALGEKGETRKKEKRKEDQTRETSRSKSLYLSLAEELEALGLDSSDSDEGLDPSEGEDLEEEAAHYETERYRPDEGRKLGKKTKGNRGKNQVATPALGPSAPPPYVENFCSTLSFPERIRRNYSRHFRSLKELKEGESTPL